MWTQLGDGNRGAVTDKSGGRADVRAWGGSRGKSRGSALGGRERQQNRDDFEGLNFFQYITILKVGGQVNLTFATI
jgi:hypothetical protein